MESSAPVAVSAVRKQLATKPKKVVAKSQMPPPLLPCKKCKESIAGDTGFCAGCEPKADIPAVSNSPPVVEMPKVEEPTQPTTTEQTIVMTDGFGASAYKFVSIPTSKVKDFLKESKSDEWYERTQPALSAKEGSPIEAGRVMNRVYIDLDGEMPTETSEKDFDSKVKAITQKLVEQKGYDWSVCESGKWKGLCCKDGKVKNKLSWSMVIVNQHGTKDAIRYFVKTTILPYLQKLLKEDIPVITKEKQNQKCEEGCLVVDMGVYKGDRKMRMVGQSKPNEQRPKKLIKGKFVDTLITYIPDTSSELKSPLNIFDKVVKQVDEPKSVEDSASVGQNTTLPPPFDPTEDDEERMELIESVCLNLGQHRYDSYNDWIRIGFILFNEGFSVEKYIELSERSKHFNKGESPTWIKQKWSAFKRGNLTQALLWKWLAEDDYDAYYELSENRKDFWNLIRSQSHADIAQFYYNLKPDAYLFHESLNWYELQPTGNWKNYETIPNGLKADIWATLKKVGKEHFTKLMEKETDDEDEQKKQKEKLKALNRFVVAVGTSGFVDGVITFLKNFYKDDRLDKKMDENRDLLAFTNGVLELTKLPEIVFRPIEPSDYICLSTGYAFPKTSNPKVRKEVLDTIRSCFDTEEEMKSDTMGDMTKAILQSISTCLSGHNKFERFNVWTGKGGNGKGMITELIKRALGDYYRTLPPEVLTKPKEGQDYKCPALAMAKGCRHLNASEPEESDYLQVSAIKPMSSQDEISARALYKNPVHYVPQFKLFLQANNIPKLNRADGGIQRRMRIFNFPYQFVKEPCDPTHKKINVELKEKIVKSSEWRDEMLCLLIDAYAQVLENGELFEPKQVLEASEEYMDDNNPIKSWLNNNYISNLNKDDRRWWVNTSELKTAYERDTNAKINPERFKSYMVLCGGTLVKASHNFKTTDEEGDEVERKAGRYWVGLRRVKSETEGLEALMK